MKKLLNETQLRNKITEIVSNTLNKERIVLEYEYESTNKMLPSITKCNHHGFTFLRDEGKIKRVNNILNTFKKLKLVDRIFDIDLMLSE